MFLFKTLVPYNMNILSAIRTRFNIISNFGNKYYDKIGRSKLSTMIDFIKCRMLYGANEEDYIGMEFYKKSHSYRKQFITSRKNFVWLYNNHYSEQDKQVFNSKCEFNPEFASFFSHKWISTKDKTKNEIMEFIQTLGEVIVKPTLGLQGLGVYKVKATDSEKLKSLFNEINRGNQYVIEEIIKQHPDMAYFNDSCVNTCRIETVVDKKGKAHILNTIVIIGGKDSEVSNTHTGGVMVHVDPETGIVDSKGRNPEGKFYLKHPGTGAVLVGRKIPFWDEVIGLAKSLAEHRPTASYIGWDIAVTGNGPALIEGNIQPGHCTQACDMVGRWPLIKKYL